jgi:hypothetical protein
VAPVIIDAKICSNCRRFVPQACDGVVYRSAEPTPNLARLLCRGRDGEDFHTRGGVLHYRQVVAHGIHYDIPLTRVTA